MRTAVTANEVNGIWTTLTRTLNTHMQSAIATNEKDRETYLIGRVKRLNEIKDECLAKFAVDKEKSE